MVCVNSASLRIINDVVALSYPEVQRVEVDLLYDLYDSPKVATDLGNLTERMVMGELPHCAEVLRALFDKLGGRIHKPKAPLHRGVSPVSVGKRMVVGGGKKKKNSRSVHKLHSVMATLEI